MRKKFLFWLLTVVLLRLGAWAQVSVNMGSQLSVTGCDIDIYDDGGSTGNYSPNHTYTLTVYPTVNQGRVLLHINSLDIHYRDTLYIYDGISASGSPMAALNNMTYISGSNISTYMASQNNTSGALTLKFKASYFIPLISSHGAGFALHTTCVAPCSPFQLALDPAHCSHVPVLHPDDGYYYIDLCPGEPVQMAVNGIYQNQQGGGYPQSDATSKFVWELEPGVTVSGTGMNQVTHTFTPGIGTQVTVKATDTLQCPANQSVNFRVRVSESPVAQIPPMAAICKGQTFTPEVDYNEGSDLVLKEVGHTQHASLTVSDTVFLPDGAYCPPYGLYYRSNVNFTEFAPGATLTNANDILYVRVKMEHSAIEDLMIEIYCPNGNSSVILPNPNWTSYSYQYYRVNMGSAYRPDGGSCNPAVNPMGEPWNYVWSNNTTLGYQYAPGGGSCYDVANFHAHFNPHWDDSNADYFGDFNHSYSVDSSNVGNMTQIYHPYQSFNSLVGCPLNGNWYIQVQDMLPEDNGYIVEWELALNNDLMPTTWEYDIQLDTFYFTGNQVIGGNVLRPMTAGNSEYGAVFIDEFGCQYDTSFHITVYDWPDVSLGEDLSFCPGTSVYLSPVTTNDAYQYTWNTGSTAQGFYTSAPGIYSVTASVVADNLTCSSSDTIELKNFAVSDTTFLSDTICQGYDYDKYGFFMSADFLNQMFILQPSWPISWFTGTRTDDDQHGCDSVVVMNLVVLRHWENEQTVFACEQYIWEGDTLTESGDYVKNFMSQHGCDSTVTLHLDIGYPQENEIEETSCGPYHWHNETFYESGDYTRTFTSIYSCDSVVTLHLTVVDTSLRTLSSNPNFCHDEETTISVEGNFDTYLWSTGESSQSIVVTSSGVYAVTASNYACERTATVIVPYCPPTLLLPNAITPGRADGLNDVFALSERDRDKVVLFSIYIFNRWGELVFFSDDKNFSWDGTKNGKPVPQSVYNYVIRCSDRIGRPYNLVGSVTVF